MDYNYTNQPEMGYRKKFDIKGLVFTIASLVLSLITALSTLMPLISMGNGTYSENINIIDTCKLFGAIIEWDSYNMDFARTMIMVMTVLVILLPIIITVFGIIFTIALVVRLVSGNYSSNVNAYAKTVLLVEMIFSTFMYWLAALGTEYLGFRKASLYDMGLSVGWYLPVILSLAVLFLRYIWDCVEAVRGADEKAKSLITVLFSSIGTIASAVMYVALSMSQYTMIENEYNITAPFSFFQVSLINSFARKVDIFSLLIWLFLIVIAILTYICFSRNLKLAKKSKFGAVISIVTGAFSVLLTIVNYILFDIYLDEYFRGATFSLGVAGYIYIVMGSILLVLGIAYLCIRTFWNNRSNMAYVHYQNNATDNNTVILQQQQNPEYYQNMQNGAYVQANNTQQ